MTNSKLNPILKGFSFYLPEDGGFEIPLEEI
jgi:hypothetical protein